MSLAMFHSFWTIGALVIFVGIILWAYSKKRHTDFDEAARLPLEDDQPLTETDKKAGHN